VAICALGLAEVAYLRGDLAHASAVARGGLAISEGMGDQQPIAMFCYRVGQIAWEQGDPAAAAAWCRHARRLARRIEMPDLEALAVLAQARARLTAGRLRAACALLEHGRRLSAALSVSEPGVQVALLTAEVRLRQGLLSDAQAAAEETLRLTAGGRYRRAETLAQRLLGRCALATSRHDEAEGHLRTALALQTEMGATLEAARTRLVLAEGLVAATGSGSIPEEARKLLAEAQAQFVASGAALDLARIEQVAATWELG
jgi:ATP/maltotriose-dependent transcriptional regulator MalT